jgi:transcriptional regulator with XRE-family HTH domain
MRVRSDLVMRTVAEKLSVANQRSESSKHVGAPMRPGTKQAAIYLRSLCARHPISAREIARQSKVFAAALNQPEYAFSYQAVLTWLEGTCYPSPEHRELLAMIFDVPLVELDRGCAGVRTVALNPASVLVRVQVHIYSRDRRFAYPLTIKAGIDLSRAAVYEHWSDLFHPFPSALMRHFGRLKRTLFGWIPHTSVPCLVHHAGSLVPLDTQQSRLKEAEFPDKKIWFVYLPDGRVDAGIAFLEGRWLTLSESLFSAKQAQRYPRSRVDLAGYVADKSLFHIEAMKKPAPRARRAPSKVA